MKILIIDDNIVIRKSLQKLLTPLADCEIVEDGKTALKVARCDTPPDLILLDVVMPEMNGHEVLNSLMAAQQTKDVPVIFISAMDDKEDVIKGLELGAVDYITKPFQKAEVLARIKTHLELRKYRLYLEEIIKERTTELLETYASLQNEMKERARLEKERQETQHKVMIQDKLATLGQVATGVAHELNQPLTYITTIIQTTIEKLKKNKIDPDKQIKKLEEAARQAARILDITTHLRTVGRADDAKREPVDLSVILKDSLMLMNEKMKLRDISLQADIPDTLPKVFGIHNKLEQVFINLTTNAIDALEKRGGGEINVEMIPEDDKIAIRYSDNGAGMPPGVKDKIFEPFYTTKERGKGTGLGMAIINDIITDHGGQITCESEEGNGTTFIITLPITQDNA